MTKNLARREIAGFSFSGRWRALGEYVPDGLCRPEYPDTHPEQVLDGDIDAEALVVEINTLNRSGVDPVPGQHQPQCGLGSSRAVLMRPTTSLAPKRGFVNLLGVIICFAE